ncbi:MAG: hypothetical protein KDN22_14545 [Verrucomicrobiae bacterium]|nr:hypothetical protein [Verrucomicrobiae bacterium]
MTPPVSSLRRALCMTAIFAGPGFLILFLLLAFFGALQPLPGAKEALKASEPASLIISMNAVAAREGEAIRRSYLLMPASLREKAMFIVSRDELAQLSVTHGSSTAFYLLATVMVAALTLTLLVSAPALWKLYRPRPVPVVNSEIDNEHA